MIEEKKVILCDKCEGWGRVPSERRGWKPLHEGIALDFYGNAMLPGGKEYVACDKCKETGRLLIEAKE